MQNIGYIYKITNLINNKCYIGQTTKTIEERYRHHIVDSKRTDRYSYKYPLYSAMRKYGYENFKLEKIETCNISELNEREIYWIDYYDTYKNGYNQTLGGDGTRYLNLNEEQIIKDYEHIKNMSKVAKIHSCSNKTIKEILLKHNIHIKSSVDVKRNEGFSIKRCDLNGNILEEYETLKDAGYWVYDNKLTNISDRNHAYLIIRTHIIRNTPFANYLWICNNYDELYKENRKEKLLLSVKKYKENINNIKDICPICNLNLKRKESCCCLECENKRRKYLFQKIREENYNINKEILKEEIRNNSFTSIAKKYEVSDNTIRKWCKKYNLPYKSSDIKKYSDEEWKNI